MAASSGKNFRIKIGNGASPEVFTAVGGARVDSFTLNNGTIDITNKDTNDWRKLLPDAGVRQASLSVTGIFTDSASEGLVRDAAYSRAHTNFRIEIGNGDFFEGLFMVTSYGFTANHDGTVEYSLSIESADEIILTTA